MATIRMYLDKRAVKRGEEAPLKIGINKHGTSAYIKTGVKIYPTQWDAKRERVKEHPNKAFIQSVIDSQKAKVSNMVMKMTADGELAGLTATQIKNKVLEALEPKASTANSFYNRFIAFSNSKEAKRTRDIYSVTAKRMLQYDKRLRTRSFEEITKDWLTGFDKFLIGCGNLQNSRSIHFRNIRAVFNDALDNDITTAYPFRKFKIKTEQTAKRALTLEQLRGLLMMSNLEQRQQRFLDYFKLMFYLIGINIVDLCRIKGVDADGRIRYRRQKTKKQYSLKVEPEAVELINKYKGKKYLLDILDTYSNERSFTRQFDKELKLFIPGLTSYSARHSWATMASEINIPEDVISHALGHSFSTGASVTQVYIDYNMKKVDDANRHVIDYVLGL